MAEAALGLGSNLGDREAHLSGAVRALENWEGVRVAALSSRWETPPWGVEEQPHFLNACVLIETSLSPIEVLDACLAIEREHGRERSLRWGPRNARALCEWAGAQLDVLATKTSIGKRIGLRCIVLHGDGS
jgi:2-amino-4-hydroxy-6-hydroxymethyldihydropteridine diphosphokinase